MISRGQRLRLGIFITVIGLLLVGFLAVVGGRRLLEERTTYYVAFTDTSVSGLQVGGTVRFRGIEVGTVENLQFDKEDIRTVIVTISVREDTPVRTDVEAQLVPVGITGLMQIELTGGSNEAPKAPAGYTIEGGKSPLDRILAPAETIATKLDTILGNISELMSAENQQRFNRIVTNLDLLVADSREPIEGIVKNLEATTGELTGTIDSVNGLLAQLATSVDEADVAAVARNLNQAIDQADVTLENIDVTVLRARRDLVESMAVLRETVEYLNDFALLISENPSLLIRSRGRER